MLLKNLIILPYSKTIKKYFGRLRLAGSLKECSTVIRNVFENLQGIQK